MGNPSDTENGKRRNLGGYPIAEHTADSLSAAIAQRLEAKQQTLLFFANTNFIVKCRYLRARMFEPSVLIVNDGVGVDIAAIMTYAKKFAANMNGTDFLPLLLSHLDAPRVYLYGAKPEVVATAASAIAAMGANVVGIHSGFHDSNLDIAGEVLGSGADVVLVGLGNPVQEQWILDNAARMPGTLLVGVGALFDFLSGSASRAPTIMRTLHLEWFYRLCAEPRRLWKRYTLDIAVFFSAIILNGRSAKPDVRAANALPAADERGKGSRNVH